MPMMLPPVPPAIVMTVQGEDGSGGYVTATRASDGAPMLLLGLAGQGSRENLDRFDAAARALGFNPGPIEDAGDPESMITFPAGTDAAKVKQLRQRLAKGEFGELSVKLFVAAQSDLADGLQVDQDIRVFDDSYLAP